MGIVDLYWEIITDWKVRFFLFFFRYDAILFLYSFLKLSILFFNHFYAHDCLPSHSQNETHCPIMNSKVDFVRFVKLSWGYGLHVFINLNACWLSDVHFSRIELILYTHVHWKIGGICKWWFAASTCSARTMCIDKGNKSIFFSGFKILFHFSWPTSPTRSYIWI